MRKKACLCPGGFTRKRFRNTLTITGIAIGAASVILIASIGDIGKLAIHEEIDSLGIGSLSISTTSGLEDVSLGLEELQLIEQQPVVESASPIMVTPAKIIMRQLTSDTILWGIGSGAQQTVSLNVEYGQPIGRQDVNTAARVCVVDKNIAKAYYKRENIVGKKISILIDGAYHDFTVCGVASSGGNMLQGMMGDIIPSFLYVPYSTMQQITGKSGFDKIAVKLSDAFDAEESATGLKNLLEQQIGVSNAYKVENMQKQKQKLSNIIDIITLVLSAIAGISLVVAGLGIMTVMLVRVHERTREIGIKKSIGARNRTILKEFVSEAFTMSAVGGIIGTVTGIALVMIGSIPFDVTVVINTKLVLICVAFSVVTGVVFGAYPALLAAKLNPVDALRME